jgi:DNA repair exonuclease SbcCD nuclease subunit
VPAVDVLVVHTSDVHVGSDAVADGETRDTLHYLHQILAAAEQAQLLLVAGDLFDNNRLPVPLLEDAAKLLSEATPRVVILPGNHDPLTTDSVYYRGPFADTENVTVLGLSPTSESVIFPEWDLEVWGRAHRSYGDMPPFLDPPPRTTRWRIAVAHGHFEEISVDARWWPSWRFRTEDLAAAQADYVALGHWNRAARVGDGQALAYYSGSPDLAGTVNLVLLAADGQVRVTQRSLGANPAGL